MIRARGLLIGGAFLATLAGFTVAVSSAGSVPTATRATTLAFVGAGSASGGPAEHLSANGPLLPSQTVDNVAPNAGQSGPGGEQEVVITGSGFTGATGVSFGGTDVTSTTYPCLSSPAGCFNQVNDTEIDADTPVESSGTVDVVVDGGTANSPADDYSYFDPPTVTSVDSPQDQGATGVAVAGANYSYPGVTPPQSGVHEVDLNPTGPGSTIKITNTCGVSTPPNCFNFEDDSDLTIDLPSSVPAGTYDVQVLTPGGTSATSAGDELTVLPPPTLTTLTPSSGSTLGGNNVNLTGTNFTGATDVNWGSDDINTVCGTGTCFTVNSDTSITVDNVPGNGAGQISVTVTTPNGTSGSKPYTYVPPPALTTLTPSSGSTLGGNNVNLTGTSFTGATDVNWGSDDISTVCGTGTCFTVNSDTSITVENVPGDSPGPISVTVTTAYGNSGSKTYTYVPPPGLTSLTPSSGSTSGGNNVNLTGTNFTGATDVNWGSDDISTVCGTGTCFTVNSPTSITVDDVPANSAGQIGVTVTTPYGTSGSKLYTYAPGPSLTTLTPSSGPTQGGNNVNLTGTNFTGVTDVNWGSDDISTVCGTGTCFTVNSATSITVESVPANSPGPVGVTVTSPNGISGSKMYTYVPPPALTTLTPSSGSTLGGNNVSLTGTNFTGATDVNWGSDDISTVCGTGTCFTVNSDTSITVDDVPANGAGQISVTVTTPYGISGSKPYTYVTPPSLTTLTPSSGSTLGGNNVNLTGTNFTGATDVNWGGDDINTVCGSGTCFTVNSDTSITVDNVPANGAGQISVTVTTPYGISGSKPYTYVPPPGLTSLTPSSGSTSGGINVNLTGTNFTGATDVNWGSDDINTVCGTGTCFTVNSDMSITVDDIPANGAGQINVTVTTLYGTSGSAPYTYDAAPTVTNLSSNEGPTTGGNTVILTGTGFEAAGTPIISQVSVGTTAITASSCSGSPTSPCFEVTSPTSLTIGYMPAGTGQVNITVTNPTGTSPSSSANTYTYNAGLPTVSQVLPSNGATSGGEEITLLGSGYGAAGQDFVTDVYFGNTDVTDSSASCPGSSTGCFVVVGPTVLDVYTPANAAGTVDVEVKTPLGRGVQAPGDKYTFVAPGAYSAVTPYRVCDTRAPGPGIAVNQCNTSPNKTLGPSGVVNVQISSASGAVPTNAQAVVVNVTAIDHSTTATFVTAYPTGATRPNASNINLSGGKVGTNLVIVQLSSSGEITLFNSVGSTDVIVDVEGYFSSPTGGTAGQFHSIPPFRICDSRAGEHTACAGTTSNPLIAGQWRYVSLSGPQSVPASGAAAAVFNLTAVGGTAPTTFLSVTPALAGHACPTSAPAFSNLNPAEGTALPNRVISKLGPNEDVCIYSALGSINFIVDVNGWFGSSGAPAGVLFYSIPPTRVCDTRPTSDTTCSIPSGRGLAPGQTDPILMAGSTAVPADNVHSTAPVAVVANLTGIAGTATTFFTLYPSDAVSRPEASDLNPGVGQVIANLAIVGIATTGTSEGDVSLYNAGGDINAILDVAGWFQ